MKRLFFLYALFAVICFPVKAETPPIPKSKTQALTLFQERLKSEGSEKNVLQKKIETIHTSLSSTKNKLITIAAKIQNNEDDLKNYERRIANLEVKKSSLEDKLHADRSSIAKLILALERIRRTPPEAMLARPYSVYKTAQSAMLMGNIVPSINRHAEKLNTNLETLERVSQELILDQESLLKTSQDLSKQHKELSNLISKRKELYTKVSHDIKAREISIQKISLQAENLEDLVKKIKEDEIKERARKEKEQKKRTNIRRTNKSMKMMDSGNARLPISGIVRTGYEQKDGVGAHSKGLTIEGRAGALITAPMSGKIQFTGTFKRYGNIVIIEHANDYHSLVAGLDTINSVVGDYVKSGEPIGLLPNSSLIPRPTLYYELRKNGKPVNPAVKFPDLG